MFCKKRIEKSREETNSNIDKLSKRIENLDASCIERDNLFVAAIAKLYSLSGYEVKITNAWTYLDTEWNKEKDSWTLVDKTSNRAVYYRKKKESNG